MRNISPEPPDSPPSSSDTEEDIPVPRTPERRNGRQRRPPSPREEEPEPIRQPEEENNRQQDPPPPQTPNRDQIPEEPRRPERRNGRQRSRTPPRPPNDADNGDEQDQQEVEELANKIEETRRMNMDERPKLIKLRENKVFKALLQKVNTGLVKLVPEGTTLTELNCINYGAAWYIQSKLAPDHQEARGNGSRKNANWIPQWKKKMQQKINNLRAEVSHMRQFMYGQNVSRNLNNKIEKIKRKYHINNGQIEVRMAEHKAIIRATAAQIRNKEAKIKTKQINRKFAENPRKVYRDIMQETIEVKEPPKREEVERFWRPLFEDPKQHREEQWIDTTIESNNTKERMPQISITEEILKKKINQYSNFKAPEVDKIPNFYL